MKPPSDWEAYYLSAASALGTSCPVLVNAGELVEASTAAVVRVDAAGVPTCSPFVHNDAADWADVVAAYGEVLSDLLGFLISSPHWGGQSPSLACDRPPHSSASASAHSSASAPSACEVRGTLRVLIPRGPDDAAASVGVGNLRSVTSVVGNTSVSSLQPAVGAVPCSTNHLSPISRSLSLSPSLSLSLCLSLSQESDSCRL